MAYTLTSFNNGSNAYNADFLPDASSMVVIKLLSNNNLAGGPRMNAIRNNRLFNESASEEVWNKDKNTKCFTGGKKSYCFDPRDEIKGDVARMLFYMVVRYEGEMMK